MKRPRKDSTNNNQIWCKFCSLWIADNRAQRDQHERGAKHKAAKARMLKEIAARNEKTRAEEDKAARAVEAARPRGHELVELAWAAAAPKRARTEDNEPEPTGGESSRAVGADLQNGAEGDGDGQNRDVDVADDTVYAQPAPPLHAADQQVDENGFPLPAVAVYGQWEQVEQGAGEGIDGQAAASTAPGEATEDTAEVKLLEDDKDTQRGSEPAEKRASIETTNGSVADQREAQTDDAAYVNAPEAGPKSPPQAEEDAAQKRVSAAAKLAASGTFKKRRPPSKSRLASRKKR